MPINYGNNNVTTSGSLVATSGTFNNLLLNGAEVSVSGHTHTSSNISDFNTSVSGLLPSVSGSGYALTSFANNIYTISVTGLQPSGDYSAVGHTHTSSNITDFSSSVSGLLPVKNILGSGYVNVSSTSGNYTVSISGLQPSGNYSAVGHTHTTSDITNFNSSVSGLVNGIYAPLTSPALTGTPTAPTATSGTNTNQIATTSFVRTEVSNLVSSAPSTLDTLNELASALGNDPNFATTITNSIANKVSKSGDTMTGTLIVPSGTFTNLSVSGTLEFYNASTSICPFVLNIPNQNPDVGAFKIVGKDPDIFLDSTATGNGSPCSITYLQSGQLRMAVGYNPPSDTYFIARYNSGVWSDSAFNVSRSNGVINIGTDIESFGNYNGSLIVAGGIGVAKTINASGGNFNNLRVNNTGVSISGHSHTSSDITNFNSAVSGLFPSNLVTGTGLTNHIAYWSDSGVVSADSGQLYWSASNNRLGIGTSSPSGALHTVGDSYLDNTIWLNSSQGYKQINTSGNDLYFNAVHGIFGYSIGLRGSRGSACGMESNAVNGYLGLAAGGNERMRITTAGSVGIGTTSPNASLEVSGNIQQTWLGTDIRIGTIFDNNWRMGINYAASQRTLNIFSTSNDTNGHIVFSTRLGAGASSTDYGTERVRITNSGFVGIGTTIPSGRLHVIGSGIFSSGIKVGDSSTNGYIYGPSGNASIQFNAAGTNRIDINSTNLYLGAATFFNGAAAYVNTTLLFPKISTPTSTATQSNPNELRFYNGLWNGSSAYDGYNTLHSIASTTVNGASRFAILMNNGDGTQNRTERLSVLSNGNIGIGTTTPSGSLDVRGNILVSGNLGINTLSAPENALELRNGTAFFYPNSSGANAVALHLGNYTGGFGQFFSIKTHDESSYRTTFLINRYSANYRFSRDSVSGERYLLDISHRGDNPDGSQINLYDTNNTSKVRISAGTDNSYFNNGGNLGIGTSSPTSQLHVIGTGNFSQNLLVNGTGVSVSGHTHTSSSITDFNTSVSGLLPTISNSGDNRLLTSTGNTLGINAENNITFDGSLLNVTGSGAFSSNLALNAQTANTIASFDTNKNIVSLSTATYPSLTELSYVKDVTSAIQTQLNAKQGILTDPITGAGSANHIAYWTSTSGIAHDANQLVWDATNNRLGIGVSSISGAIHTNSDPGQWSSFNYAANLLIQGSRNNGIGIYDSTNSNPIAIVNNGGALRIAHMPAVGVTGTAPSNRVSFNLDGTVGIGSTGTGGYKVFVLSAPNSGLAVNDGTNTIHLGGDGNRLFLGIPNATPFTINTNGQERMRVDASGNVGIGVSSPTEKIHVSGNALITGSIINKINNRICDGRLTLESGVPISTTDQTSKTTIFFTPYQGNAISLYDGSQWKYLHFAETSVSLGTLIANTNYDIFAYDNSGTLALEIGPAWTNDTTRSTAIVLQDGIYVRSGSTTRRYLGTFRTVTTTTTESSLSRRFLWNFYNQVLQYTEKVGITTDITTTSASYVTTSTALDSVLLCGLPSPVTYFHNLGVSVSAAAATDLRIAVRVGSNDHDVGAAAVDTVNFIPCYGTDTLVTAAGAYTVSSRWRRSAGTGTLRILGASRGGYQSACWLSIQQWG
jgi:hypothetical protein